MKKLTKTQKNILKKKILRISNIVALIVGGLSFLVVLYAIIAGSLKSTAPETAEVSAEVPAPSPLVQSALQPPPTYDLEFSPDDDNGDFFAWQNNLNNHTALFEENIATIDYFSNSFYWHDMLITINVYEPTTYREYNGLTFAFQGDYLGSAASPAFQRFRITLDNRNSAQAFLFYADFSSSGYNVTGETYIYDNENNFLGLSSPFASYANGILRLYYVPPYSSLKFNIGYTTTNVYLDALYIDDIGAYAYETGFDDGGYHGYEDGYDVGFDDGYDVGEFDGYADGLDVGYTGGYEDGYFDAEYEYGDDYDDGYDLGHTAGYNDGYEDGVGMTVASADMVENAFDLIYAGAQSVDKILSISIFGSITLGMLLFTPLIIGISLAVIKIIKG